MKEIRVRLEGEQARLGEVPAADVARLLLALERAASQAAAVVLGQPKTTTGRYLSVIEQAVRFRLRAIEPGSVVPVLELPEVLYTDDPSLDLEDPRLGEAAIEALMAAAETPNDPRIAQALLGFADTMRLGDRYVSVTFDIAADARPARTITIDGATRANLQRYVDSAPSPEARPDDVSGRLFEANFERRTAILRTATHDAVEVAFSEDQEETIQSALRQTSTVRGDVTYDPKTNMAKNVRLTEIVLGVEQLTLDPGDFWRELSFDELAERQHAGAVVDPSSLYDADASDADRDAFMAALAEIA
jgi:hypothetical protein